MTLILSRTDVQELLDMHTTIEILEPAFASLSAGKAVMPTRTPIKVEDEGGLALFMPALIPDLGALGAKIVTVYKENPSKFGIPNVLGTIVLLDKASGDPVCIMEGGFLTAMRTGGASGVATKHMARADSKVHVVFGTGVQARTQAWAVAAAAQGLQKCIVHSLDPPEMKHQFAEGILKLTGIQTSVAESAEAATREADILTLATSSAEPVISADWLKPGVHINGIGSHTANMREIDTETVVRSRIVCDHVASCKAEAGDFIIPANEGKWNWNAVVGELGEVVSGKVDGRTSNDEITLFKSVGLAIQDLSVARAVFQKALEKGRGLNFNFR
ncbi:MAG: ornithine cyclodeaminase family protein [bacterium]|jgi:ornithine cyclodeaminase/alanine dehydrogenase-like protein (mu-crystallin family)